MIALAHAAVRLAISLVGGLALFMVGETTARARAWGWLREASARARACHRRRSELLSWALAAPRDALVTPGARRIGAVGEVHPRGAHAAGGVGKRESAGA